ncbi:MAG: enoyl-CoA hydratase/isomerase family protein [Planctomycetes bacterium]|nr:enoyl-CoA hydratase/isomerase family protein [Planctomycetota bacterium]
MSIAAETTHGGRRARVVFGGSNGNILGTGLLGEFTKLMERLGADRSLRCITIEGEGANFSYGASVQEHAREGVAGMLAAMGACSAALLFCDIPTIALVRGQCLGGGLELALCCSRIVGAKDAHFGFPEIKLGVFAPIGSLLLPLRLRSSRAEELLISGRSLRAAEALEIGLVDDVALDPEPTAAALFEREWLGSSASSLRFAVAAARAGVRRGFREQLREMESLYLTKLMRTADAEEGMRAFLERRAPVWKDA